jgi:glycosyltransferase involved in cell wall biosynthesis
MEIFIIDDYSIDGTKEKVESWAKLDERIKPIYKSVNSGYVDSLNMAIGLSNGEYIARMDGDDISLPERIARQVGYMNLNLEIGVLGCGYRLLGTNKSLIPVTDHDLIKIGLLIESQLAHPTVMFRASMLKRLDRLYKAEFIPCEDYEFWVYLSSKTIIHNLKDVLLEYRVHNGNTSKNHSKNSELLKQINRIQLKNLGLNSVEADIFNLKNILRNKAMYIKRIELYSMVDLIKKVVFYNRKFKLYNTELFEGVIYEGLKTIEYSNPIYTYIVKIYIKYKLRNLVLKSELKLRQFSYVIIDN